MSAATVAPHDADAIVRGREGGVDQQRHGGAAAGGGVDGVDDGTEHNTATLDETRNMLSLHITTHLVAAEYYSKYYYALAIPSIALSSFLAIIGYVAGSNSETIGALLNACNTIALGVLALLRYQSKCDLHESAAKSLQSLKLQIIELRDQLDHLTKGCLHDSTPKNTEVGSTTRADLVT